MKGSTNMKSKSKKSSRDRERRKSHNVDHKSEHLQQTSENTNLQEAGVKKYAGLGKESIICYAEQSFFEHLHDDACYSFAEDLSYKLRHIINDSVIKARLSCRNSLKGCDVEASLTNFHVDKVYGATNNSNYMPFPDQNLYYLDDTVINLVEIAEEVSSCIQPSSVEVRKTYFPPSESIEDDSVVKSLIKYFKSVCLIITTTADDDLKKTLLADLSTNTRIASIVNWFYRFCYIQLNKYITEGQLFNYNVLYMLQSLEMNALGRQMLMERELILLFQLLCNMWLVENDSEKVNEIVRTLKMLCTRIRLRKCLIRKLIECKFQIKDRHPSLLLFIANEIGPDVFEEFAKENLLKFLVRGEDLQEPKVLNDLLNSYNTMHKYCIKNRWENDYLCVFGQAIVPFWRPKGITPKKEKPDFLVNYSRLSFASRRRISPPLKAPKMQSVAEMFELYSFNMNGDSSATTKQTHIVIGKRSDYFLFKKSRSPICCDHSLYNVLI